MFRSLHDSCLPMLRENRRTTVRRKIKTAILLAIFAACGFLLACGNPNTTPPPLHVAVANSQNPLVAQVTISSGCTGQAMVEFGPDTSYGRSTSLYPIVGLQPLTVQVAGMRASTLYHMRVQRQCFGVTTTSADTVFTSGAPPAIPFPAVQVSRSDPPDSTENPGVELLDTIATTGANQIQAFVTDRDGNPIWYYDVGQGKFPYIYKLLPNGNFLFMIVDPTGGDSWLREVDLAGNTIRQIDILTLQQRMQATGLFDFVPEGFHHDFLLLDNGHIIVLVTQTKEFTDLPGYPGITQVIGDGLVDLDSDFNPVWAWNGFDFLDVTRHLFGLPDWTHSNAVIYSPSDGNLIVSMRHQSWVIKIDYNNGAGSGSVKWRLGYQGDFTLAQGDNPSLWFSFQHFPVITTQSGTQTSLAIWDNGDYRPLDTIGTTCVIPGPPVCYSRAAIFQVDEDSKVADLTWQYSPGMFSIWGGSINQLANGNVEFDLNAPQVPPSDGVASQLQEVTQTDTPTVIWKMDVPLPVNAYRAYRIPSLYPGVIWEQ